MAEIKRLDVYVDLSSLAGIQPFHALWGRRRDIHDRSLGKSQLIHISADESVTNAAFAGLAVH